MALGNNSAGIQRGGAGGSGPIKPSSTPGSKKTNPSSSLSANPNLKNEEQEFALSGRYGFQEGTQQEAEKTVNQAYYDRVKIPGIKESAGDARTEMPGIYQQIANYNNRNTWGTPGSNDLGDYDDNSFSL